jgi:NTE family protein
MFRQLLVTILLFSGFLTAFSQSTQRPKVAVVLSGGGAKGFAHIGVLKVLEKEGIPIDIMVGTSIGSIVGGLYALGYTADDIEKIAKRSNWTEFLSDYVPRTELDQNSKIEHQRYVFNLPVSEKNLFTLPGGVVNGQNVLNYFCGMAGNLPIDVDFTKLPIAYACVGTDLLTGNEIVMKSGYLPTAIFSSMAIPGVFVPAKHNGNVLVDGGLVNNFPADVAKGMGADIIIGVDLRKDLYSAEEVGSIDRLTAQIISFYSLRKDSVNYSYCNIVIKPDINGYNTSSFYKEAVDTLLMRGTASANAVIDEIRELKRKYNLQPRPVSRELIQVDQWDITDIRISGNYSMPPRLLIDVFNLDVPGRYTYNEIKKSVNNLYGMGVFKRVYFVLEDNENGKTLTINLEESKAWDINVGMRLNTRDGVSVVLNSTRKDYTKTFGLLSFTADISAHPRFNFLAELDKRNLPKLALMVDGLYTDLAVHAPDNNFYRTRLYTGAVKLYTYQPLFNYSILGAGIKQEFYSGMLYGSTGEGGFNIPDNQRFLTHFYGYYHFDNLDDYYFPTVGSEIYAEASIAQYKNFNVINPIVLLKFRKAIKINDQMTLMANVNARSLLSDASPAPLLNYIANRDYEITLSHHLPFYGMPTLWATERTTIIGGMVLRKRVYRQHYVSVATNLLFHNDVIFDFENYKSIFGVGLTYSYKSPFGPVELTIGFADKYKKVTASANVGFWF